MQVSLLKGGFPRTQKFSSILVAACLFISGCSEAQKRTDDLIISNVRVYEKPGAEPLVGVSIVIRDGKIIEIGPKISTKDKRVLDGNGRAVTAGLWNSHVHFTNPDLKVEPQTVVKEMTLKYGFTTVIDTGSYLPDTLALAKLIEKGKIVGPRILNAAGSFVFTDGTPSYLPGIKLPEISVPEDAEPLVAAVLNSGAQGIKIFSGSFISPTETIHLPPSIIHAVAKAAHSRGGFVISHPTDRTSLINAIENGVDVLAHTAPAAGPLGQKIVDTMKDNNVALIPTLKLLSFELQRFGANEAETQRVQNSGVAQLTEYYLAGGEVLFGTDAGYMDDFDTKEEFVLMQQAGMDFESILASLTTNPASRFSEKTGQVSVGSAADLVIYADDPMQDVTAFSRVLYTIRGGEVVFCGNNLKADICP